MAWSVRRAWWMGLLALSLLLGTMAFLSYRYAADLSRARAALDRTVEVTDALQDLMGALTDAETGQRGFLVTHDVSYLKPYHVALESVPRLLRAVRTLAAGNPVLEPDAAALAELAGRELAELQRVIGIAENVGFAAASEAVRTDIGLGLMRHLRARIADVRARLEASDRADRERATRAEARTAQVVFITVVFSVLAIAVAGWMMTMELAERRRTAAELRRLKEAAEAAVAAKASLLTFLSHEMRSPLTSIIGFADLLEHQALGPLGSARYVDYVANIHKGGEHLLGLIDDILDLARAESGEFRLEETDLAVDEIVEASVALLAPQAARAGVVLSCSPSAVRPTLRADGKRVKQIVVNLVGNAIKYTPRGGEIAVAVAPQPDGALALVVEDTGIGIAPRHLARVLEPFHQIDNERNRASRGTGLGLPITKRLVELHGGTLTLESEVGAGTKATVRFPAERVSGGGSLCHLFAASGERPAA